MTTTSDVVNSTDGKLSLREAVLQSNAAAGADTIVIPAGTYMLSIPGANENDAATGDLDVTGALTIQGAGAGTTVIDGAGVDRVFDARDAGLSLSALTVRGGRLTSSGSTTGGGVSAVGGDLTLTDCVLTDNRSHSAGGGVYASQAAVTVVRSTFSGNQAGNDGGGLWLVNGSLAVRDSTFASNTGIHGGGIGWFGGTVDIARTTFAANSTSNGGGGLYGNDGSLTVSGCAFVGNTKTLTGTGTAIYLQTFHTSMTAVVSDTTISGNADAAVVFFSTSSAHSRFTLQNSTVTANESFGLRVIDTKWSITLVSTILARNNVNGTDLGRDLQVDVPVMVTHSLIGNPGFTTFAGGSGNNLPSGTNPQLGALADNGGPTLSHAPLPGSPLLNAGSNPAGLPYDQRGSNYNRTSGGATDIGSVEVVSPIPSALAVLPDVAAPAPSYTVQVTYFDDTGIQPATLGTGDLVVSGPNGFSAVPVFVAVDSTANGTPRTATYTFAAPGGSWDVADNGSYTVSLVGGEVLDVGGAAVPGTALGVIRVIFPVALVVTNANDSGPGSLRAAIEQANAIAPAADTIVFDPQYFTTPRTVTLTTGPLTITDSVTIIGPGPDFLTVHGNQAGRIVNIDAPGTPTIAISGLTLTGGAAVGTGGAVSIQDELVTLSGVFITGNSATAGGGGVAVAAGGSLTLFECVVSNNRTTAAGGDGGGLYSAATVANSASITVRRTSFANNRAFDGGGGLAVNGGALLIEDSTLSGNTATGSATSNGGAVYVFGTVAQNGAVIRNSTVAGNTAVGSGTGTITGGSGGGVALRAAGTLLIQNSTVTGNRSVNTTSKAAGYGGGGLTVVAGSLTLSSTIVAENLSGNGRPDIAAGTTVLANYSLIGVAGPGFTLSWPHVSNRLGTPAAPLDPLLGPLADNGGPTLTRLPAANSPAVNAGSNQANAATDQRGQPRGVGAAPDIGAVETSGTAPVGIVDSLEDVFAPYVNSFNPYQFTVRWRDETAVRANTIGAGDVRVARVLPTGSTFTTTATLVGPPPTADAGQIAATYQFTPPGGAWNGDSAGVYVVSVEPGQVTDGTASAPVVTLGSFRVLVPMALVVTNTNDAGPGSLRHALADANILDGTIDTILFNTDPTQGTDFDDAITDVITLTSGELTVTDPVTVTGPGRTLLTISGNGSGRIVNATGAAVPWGAVTLSDLTLTGGVATGDGGAILAGPARVTLTRTVVTGNTAVGGDGGAAFAANGGYLTIQDSIIAGNRATGGGGDGGAVAINGPSTVLFVRNSTITTNTAGRGGGGINLTGGNLILFNSTVSGNLADGTASTSNGGGVYISGSVGPDGVLIRNSTISGNTAVGSGTGTVSGGTGGGVHAASAGTIVIQNSTITGNRSVNTNSPLAGRGAGGVAATASAQVRLFSTIVAGNTSDNGRPDVAANALVTANFSLIGVADVGFGLAPASGSNLTGTAAQPLAPRLGPLADNGGPTRTHALLTGSPALNAGSNSLNLETDQRGPGFARVVGPATDIGAYEYTPVGVESVQVNDGSAQRSMVRSLTVTFSGPVMFANNNPAAAFTVSRITGTGGTVGLSAVVSADALGRTVVTLTFTGGAATDPQSAQNGGRLSLADGRYQLSIADGAVTDTATGWVLDGDANGTPGGVYLSPQDTASGGAGQLRLFRLFGDSTGNGVVDLLDLGVLRRTFNAGVGNAAYLDYLDANNNGVVDLVDLGEFRSRFNATLFP